MTVFGGLRGTGSWGPDQRPKNFRDLILWRNPNGDTPIFALMAKAKKSSTNDPEFSWWDEPNDIIRLQVNGALTNADTTFVIDSTDPSVTAPGSVYGSALNLVPGDLLLVEPSTDVATFSNEVVTVVSVTNLTTFVVARASAGSTALAIADNTFLTKIGTAFAEGTAGPKSSSRNPIKYSNYTQIFKTGYEITGTAKSTVTRTGDELKNDKKRKTFDHARDIEMALLFGRKSEVTGSNGQPLRTTDGIRRFIAATTSSILPATTISNFLDAIYPVFDYNTPAGDTRIGFCGNNALNALNKMIQTDSNTQIQFGGIITQYGMNFREFRLPQGTILLRTHPLLNRHGLYRNSMFLLDFSSLTWRPLAGRDTKFKDNVQNGDEDLQRGEIMTEGGLEVDYAGLTNGYIGNIV